MRSTGSILKCLAMMSANIHQEESVSNHDWLNYILKFVVMCQSNLLSVEFLVGRPGVDGGAVVAEGVVQRLDPVQQRVGHRVAAKRPLQREQDPRLSYSKSGLAAH